MIASPRLERHKRRHCEGIITGTFYMSAVCAFAVYNLSTTSTPCNSRKTTSTSKFTLASGSECLLRKESETWARWTKWSEGTKVYWTLIINASEVLYNFLEWRYIHIVRIHWASERRVRTAKARQRTDGTNLFYGLVPEGRRQEQAKERQESEKIISNIHSQTRRRFLHLMSGTSWCRDDI